MGGTQSGQTAQVTGEDARHFLPHSGNTEGIDEALQGDLATGVNGLNELLRREFGKALPALDLFSTQLVEIRR